MADPTTENKTASLVNSILKAVIEDKGEDAVIALVLADTPQIVAIPVIGAIWSALVKYFVGKLGDYFYTQSAYAATKIVIDLQINGEKSAVSAAFQNLQMAEASGDAYAIKKTSGDLDAAFGALIHFDGSASP